MQTIYQKILRNMANDSIALISKSYLDRNTVTSSTQLDSVTQVGKYVDAKVIKEINEQVQVIDDKLTIVEVVDPRIDEPFENLDRIYDFLRSKHHPGEKLFELSENLPDNVLIVTTCMDGNKYFFTSNEVPEASQWSVTRNCRASYSCLYDPDRREAKRHTSTKRINVKKPFPLNSYGGVHPGDVYYFQYGRPRFKVLLGPGKSFTFRTKDAETYDVKAYSLYEPDFDINVNYLSSGINRITLVNNDNSYNVCIVFSLTLNMFEINSDSSFYGFKKTPIYSGAEPLITNDGSSMFETITFHELPRETNCKQIKIGDDHKLVYDETLSKPVTRENIYNFTRREIDFYRRVRRQIKKHYYSYGDMGPIRQDAWSPSMFYVSIFADFLIIKINKPFYFIGTITVKYINKKERITKTVDVYFDGTEIRDDEPNYVRVVETGNDGKCFYDCVIEEAYIDAEDYQDEEPKVWVGHTTRRAPYRKVRKRSEGTNNWSGMNGLIYYQHKYRGVKALNKHEIVVLN